MNEDFTLTTFAEPITDLADEPQLPADEMKRRLQAPADELRQAHNALAQTVHGITDATYPDTVTEAMLTDELAAKINGKADADDVTALDDRLDTVETEKCEVYYGTYTGDGTASRLIELGFQPKAVLSLSSGVTIYSYGTYGGLAFPDQPVKGSGRNALAIEETGFRVYYVENSTIYTNRSGNTYVFLAFK